jgi:hypothetical protein
MIILFGQSRILKDIIFKTNSLYGFSINIIQYTNVFFLPGLLIQVNRKLYAKSKTMLAYGGINLFFKFIIFLLKTLNTGTSSRSL